MPGGRLRRDEAKTLLPVAFLPDGNAFLLAVLAQRIQDGHFVARRRLPAVKRTAAMPGRVSLQGQDRATCCIAHPFGGYHHMQGDELRLAPPILAGLVRTERRL